MRNQITFACALALMAAPAAAQDGSEIGLQRTPAAAREFLASAMPKGAIGIVSGGPNFAGEIVNRYAIATLIWPDECQMRYETLNANAATYKGQAVPTVATAGTWTLDWKEVTKVEQIGPVVNLYSNKFTGAHPFVFSSDAFAARVGNAMELVRSTCDALGSAF